MKLHPAHAHPHHFSTMILVNSTDDTILLRGSTTRHWPCDKIIPGRLWLLVLLWVEGMTSTNGVSMRDMMMWRVDRIFRDPDEVLFGCWLNAFIIMMSRYSQIFNICTRFRALLCPYPQWPWRIVAAWGHHTASACTATKLLPNLQ